MGAAAQEEEPFAHFVKGLFLDVALGQVERHPLGLGGDPGRQRSHVVLLAFAKGRCRDVGDTEALQSFHASKQARLQVLHALSVRKIAGQGYKHAFDHARAFAQVTPLQGGLVGPPLLNP